MEEPRFERNPDFIFRRIVDEAVLVPVHRQVTEMRCLYTLNDVAAFLWERLERTATSGALQTAILDEYEVGAEVAARDLHAFLAQMEEIGAIRPVRSETEA